MKAFWWRAWELGRRIEGMSGRSLGTWEEHGGVSGGVSEHWRSMEELGGWICPYICSRRGEALGGVCGSLGGSGKNFGGVWEALGSVWEVLGGARRLREAHGGSGSLELVHVSNKILLWPKKYQLYDACLTIIIKK